MMMMEPVKYEAPLTPLLLDLLLHSDWYPQKANLQIPIVDRLAGRQSVPKKMSRNQEPRGRHQTQPVRAEAGWMQEGQCAITIIKMMR